MKSRILFVVPLPPPIHGSAMMCKYIQDSVLINNTFECDYVNLSTSRRMDEIGRRSLKKIFRFVGSYFAVFAHLIRHRYDVCYLAITCHGIGFLKDAPFVLLCKLLGRKVVIHQHNKGMAKDVDRWPYKWLLPLVYRNSTVILLSWKLYPDIAKVVKKEQVVICPNGIPDLDVLPRQSKNLVPHLLFLSNLLESKGVIDLLDACKILKEQGYKFICNFVGSETKEISEQRFKEEVHSRKLDEIVCYEGSKYGNDKQNELSKSDMLVFPTFYENECFPVVLLEAMQHSLPTITTNEGGITDIVVDGDTGLIADKQSPKSLASKIKILLENPEMGISLGEEGRKQFLDKFSLGRYEDAIKDVITNVNGGGGKLC